jgi:S1-C subfamily serine protease
MRKVLLTALLSLCLLSPALADNWSLTAEKVGKSIVEVENKEGACTAFVIDANHEKNTDLLMTAAHCDGEGLYADHSPAKVVSKDTKNDLMVIEVEDTDKPALKLAKANPKIGEEVMSYGYGYALDRPLARVAHISDDKTYIPDGGVGGPFLVTDTSFVPGQSGGPVVNSAGEVVMIVQMGNSVVGLGRGAEIIKGRMGKYFGKVEVK